MDILKRKRARAIIISDEKIMVMYRELNDRVFYAFPGGGMEGSESEEECVIREVNEEFGINVKPIKKVYVYETEKSIEYFYLCEWLNGEFATGKGEEFDKNNTNGVYIPELINISDIPNLPLMPKEIAESFFKDYSSHGKALTSDIKHFVV